MELETILSQKELLWYQKWKREWISCDDKNTTFFHRKTITRRGRNRVEAIQSNEGTWIYNKEKIKSHAIDFFSKLFYCDDEVSFNFPIANAFRRIEDYNLVDLSRTVLCCANFIELASTRIYCRID